MIMTSLHTNINYIIGFHDKQEKSFGIVKKGPGSDFLFNSVAEVICDETSSSGYFIDLTPSNSNTRYKRFYISIK